MLKQLSGSSENYKNRYICMIIFFTGFIKKKPGT
jgi:hypothetical protein